MKSRRFVTACGVVGLLVCARIATAQGNAEEIKQQIKAAQQELSQLTRGGWQSDEFATVRKTYDDLRTREREKKQAVIDGKPECAELSKKCAALRAQEAEAQKKLKDFAAALEKDPDIQALRKTQEEARNAERTAAKAVNDKIQEKMKANPEIAAAQTTVEAAGKEARELEGKVNSALVAGNPRVAELQTKVKELQAKYDELKKQTAKKPAAKKEGEDREKKEPKEKKAKKEAKTEKAAQEEAEE